MHETVDISWAKMSGRQSTSRTAGKSFYSYGKGIPSTYNKNAVSTDTKVGRPDISSMFVGYGNPLSINRKNASENFIQAFFRLYIKSLFFLYVLAWIFAFEILTLFWFVIYHLFKEHWPPRTEWTEILNVYIGVVFIIVFYAWYQNMASGIQKQLGLWNRLVSGIMSLENVFRRMTMFSTKDMTEKDKKWQRRMAKRFNDLCVKMILVSTFAFVKVLSNNSVDIVVKEMESLCVRKGTKKVDINFDIEELLVDTVEIAEKARDRDLLDQSKHRIILDIYQNIFPILSEVSNNTIKANLPSVYGHGIAAILFISIGLLLPYSIVPITGLWVFLIYPLALFVVMYMFIVQSWFGDLFQSSVHNYQHGPFQESLINAKMMKSKFVAYYGLLDDDVV